MVSPARATRYGARSDLGIMMFESEPIIVLLLIVGGAWLWNSATRVRERVLVHCRRVCDEMRVQLLDQTVALSKLSLGRDRYGRTHLQRWYAFEFSTHGADRHRGAIVLLGAQIQFVRLEHPEGPIIVSD
jgi:hypothetical protein